MAEFDGLRDDSQITADEHRVRIRALDAACEQAKRDLDFEVFRGVDPNVDRICANYPLALSAMREMTTLDEAGFQERIDALAQACERE